MKKHYLLRILLFCFGLLTVGSLHATSSNEIAHNSLLFKKLVATAKDTLSTTEKDSTKAVKINANHLVQLRQMAAIKNSLPLGISLNQPIAKKEAVKTYRSFPTLDQKLGKDANFNVSFTNQEPEFTPEFIAANFTKDPASEKFLKEAKAALEAVSKLGNFVDIITGKTLLELPVGLKKKDKTSGNTVELAITEVKFTPQYAEFKAWAKMVIPEKGELKDGEKRGVERELFFGAEGIKLSHDGALIGGMKLVLLGNQAIPINGDNWLLTLKGGINLKKGTFGDHSFIEFDCSSLKAINLEGDLRISRKVLLPITSGGNYVCGESSDNKKLKDSNVINNKCYVGASFSIKADGWNDLLVAVTLPQFEIKGLKGWGFNIKNAVLDLSDSRNAPGINFPKDYSEVLVRGQRELWRGFYAKEVSVMLPKGIENSKTSVKRVQFGAQNLILDSQGVSGTFFGENVLQKGDGSAGKWAFTIEDISISLSRNALTGGSIGGDIAVPIFEEPMDYKGYIAPNEYGLKVGLKSDYKTPVFLGEMLLERNSSVAINVKEGHVYPYANLTGKLSIAGKIDQKPEDPVKTPTKNTTDGEQEETTGFAFKGIEFQNLELQTEPGKRVIQADYFGYKGEMKLMGFPATISDLALITPNNQVGLSFDLAINLDDEGSHATTSLQILGELKDGAKIQEWKFKKVKVKGIDIDYTKGNLTIKGGLKVMEDDPIYWRWFCWKLNRKF